MPVGSIPWYQSPWDQTPCDESITLGSNLPGKLLLGINAPRDECPVGLMSLGYQCP